MPKIGACVFKFRNLSDREKNSNSS